MNAIGHALALAGSMTWEILTPDRASAHMPDEGISWNYTTWLHIAFLLLAALLMWRFLSTGGRQMLTTMGGTPSDGRVCPEFG